MFFETILFNNRPMAQPQSRNRARANLHLGVRRLQDLRQQHQVVVLRPDHVALAVVRQHDLAEALVGGGVGLFGGGGGLWVWVGLGLDCIGFGVWCVACLALVLRVFWGGGVEGSRRLPSPFPPRTHSPTQSPISHLQPHCLPLIISNTIHLPLHLHRVVLRDALPAVHVELDVVEELPQDAVAEAVVVEVLLWLLIG